MRFTKPEKPQPSEAVEGVSLEPNIPAAQAEVDALETRHKTAVAEVEELEGRYRNAARCEALDKTPDEPAAAVLDKIRLATTKRDGLTAALDEARAKLTAATVEHTRQATEAQRLAHVAEYNRLAATARTEAAAVVDEWNAMSGHMWRLLTTAKVLMGEGFRDCGGPAAGADCLKVARGARVIAFNSGRKFGDWSLDVQAVEPASGPEKASQ